MKQLKMDNKGQMMTLVALGLGIVVLVIILAIGSVLLAEFRTQDAVTESGANNTTNAVAVIDTGAGELVSLSGWIGLIVLIVIGVIVLGYFGVKRFATGA